MPIPTGQLLLIYSGPGTKDDDLPWLQYHLRYFPFRKFWGLPIGNRTFGILDGFKTRVEESLRSPLMRYFKMASQRLTRWWRYRTVQEYTGEVSAPHIKFNSSCWGSTITIFSWR